MSQQWYVIVTGIKNGEQKKARLKMKDEDTADSFIENFSVDRYGVKSTKKLMEESGWEKFNSYVKKSFNE